MIDDNIRGMAPEMAYLAIRNADNEMLRRLLRVCNPAGMLAEVVREELARRNVS